MDFPRLIYNLVWPLGLIIFLPRYLVKMFRRGGYREKFGQRLGFYARDVRQRLSGKKHTWVHAVSVGEIAVALKLIRQLQQAQPNELIVLTTTTTTGFAFARQNLPQGIELMYMPLDFWPIMRSGFGVINPARIVLVEAEVWPNLMAIAQRRGVPVALVNARLSPRSGRRFQKFKAFVSPLFRQLKFISLADAEDVPRWQALGVDHNKIHVVGSVKYDPALDVVGTSDPRSGDLRIAEPNQSNSNLVLLGGSTHQGEEEILTDVFLNLRKDFPSLHLFLAPRHTERARDVRRKLENRNLSAAFVSEGSSPASDCLILDRTGELQKWYGVATVAFVGKSLTMHGGQNPVEPVVAGVPVLFGPHMENFAAIARELLAKKGAIEVRDLASLESAAKSLLADAVARQSLVINAQAVVARHRGATERTVELINKLL